MTVSEEKAEAGHPPAGTSLLPARMEQAEPGVVARYLESLPRDVGWLLVTAGIVAELAPGVIGTPFWVAGTLVLWPRMGYRLERWLHRRTPKLLYGGLRQIDRFLTDLERRYPRAQ
ncbi:hypothetical protein [Methylococcus capsulatus]|jgi:hypothetical protein|uniref:Uncharacterized protein n=1 Tax=Methylococcus capsulatus TaxID=414 RepID=A0AA35UC18_METCP|nr:hypothetical protein [Methylococcus capsulatus]CAI8730748.1 conserved protein of unknown function [Methylococcus capsulatus]